jgi:hypothetical protein
MDTPLFKNESYVLEVQERNRALKEVWKYARLKHSELLYQKSLDNE